MKSASYSPTVWLVGGSGKLGLSIADRLGSTYKVINLSRHQIKVNSKNFLNLFINLTDIPQVCSTIGGLLETDYPRAVIFCQRYRPPSDSNNINILSGINTEIIAPQSIIEELINRKSEKKCSIVVISSINGTFINKDLPFWYHWFKSSQMQLVKYYSIQNDELNININCIAAGSFLKYEISTYPEKQKKSLERLSQANPMKNITHLQDIVAIVNFLISDNAAMINGQVIVLDGGMSNILQETLV